jgi:hypothetical protein
MNAILIEQAQGLGLPLLHQAGLGLVPLKHCQTLLDSFEKAGILVLGMEGFTCIDNQIVPEMDMIADYSNLIGVSWDQACQESLASARTFFEGIPADDCLVFSFELRRPIQTATTPDSERSPTPRG